MILYPLSQTETKPLHTTRLLAIHLYHMPPGILDTVNNHQVLDIMLCSAILHVFEERQKKNSRNQVKILLKFNGIRPQNFWVGQRRRYFLTQDE